MGQAWADLLLLANHKEGFVRKRGIKITIARGQVGWSERQLAERWGWSRGKVSRFLEELEDLEQVEQKNGPQNINVTSLITIINYDKYQSSGPQTGRKRAANSTMNNNENNENKESIGKFTPPSIEEIRAYCQERNNEVDPQRFVDFYESKGWMIGKNKMKDWKAAVRSTWEKPVPKISIQDAKQPETSTLSAEQIRETMERRYAGK